MGTLFWACPRPAKVGAGSGYPLQHGFRYYPSRVHEKYKFRMYGRPMHYSH